MASRRTMTCQIRYKLDLSKLSEFEAYARAWILLVERYGGTHHGYFIPRVAPDVTWPQPIRNANQLKLSIARLIASSATSDFFLSK